MTVDEHDAEGPRTFDHNAEAEVHLSTDTGGTFTDFVSIDGRGIQGYKLLSTPHDPSICIARGLERFNSLASFSHGTTVATNAVLERKGDRTALVTSQGFRDVVFIGRQQRQHLYSFSDLKPKPLILRKDVFELDERVDSTGQVLRPLKLEDVERLARHLSELRYDSVAVVFLFSFLNPDHESMVGSVLRKAEMDVSLSSEVLPEYREYERTSTTLLDAYIRRKLGSYLATLQGVIGTKGLDQFHVMESEGGVAPSSIVERIPAKGLLSGPAGGVSGAVHLGKRIGVRNLITLDMGGTSTDVARITDLLPEYTTESKISGLPLSRRNLDIITIGAGGGSIADVDTGGAIRVGPESAGADPGPVCYGRGGQKVTVTDVNLLAGFLNPVDFLGKGRNLDVDQTMECTKALSRSLGCSVDETILGVRKVVNHSMAGALRMVTTEAGKDPGEYALVAFGGAGPIHAADLARELGMKKVIIPVAAGMFSAFGILISDVLHSFSRTDVTPLKIRNLETGQTIMHEFQRKGADLLEKSGIGPDDQRFLPSVDIRYRGQSWSLNIPFSPEIERLTQSFKESYQEKFGYALEEEMEIVNFRMEARGKRSIPTIPDLRENEGSQAIGERQCLFNGWETTPIFMRKLFGSGFSISGPCIIEDNGSTIVIPPGCKVKVDRTGTLEVSV